MKKITSIHRIFGLVGMLISSLSFSQNVGISSTGVVPDPSAGLDINFNDKGLLIPRLTTAQRNAIPSPAHSLLIWNVTSQCLEVYSGTACVTGWLPIWCVNPPITLSTINGPTCGFTNTSGISYSVGASGSVSGYSWTVPSGMTITAGQGTNSITVSVGSSTVSGNVCVTATNSCGGNASQCLAVNYINHGSITFNYTGAVQNWTVPSCVTTVTIKCWGAGGGGGGGDNCGGSGIGGKGGGGAYSSTVVTVSGGNLLQVFVGGGGVGGLNNANASGGGAAGWGYAVGGIGGNAGNVGGSGGGGGGGGSTGVVNLSMTSTLCVAAGGGGGGGGGNSGSCAGGAGGGGGQNGTTSSGSGGIAGGNGVANGSPGGNMSGDGGGGGGGGGGYTNGGTGGGAAASCDCGGGGGGGGNSLGTVVNGSGQTPGNNADPDLCSGCAVGGNGGVFTSSTPATNGGNGFVKIYW